MSAAGLLHRTRARLARDLGKQSMESFGGSTDLELLSSAQFAQLSRTIAWRVESGLASFCCVACYGR